MRALAEAMFAQDGEVESGRLDAHVEEVDRFISAASKGVRFGLRVALLVLWLAPMLMLHRATTVDRLRVEERAHVLARLERSALWHLSLAFVGWRSVMTLVFYEDPTELRQIGYTSDERHRYKRRLPALTANVPVPDESGVRLRAGVRDKIDNTDDTGDARPSREVA
ncbi:hypothetical protein [Labilithrix luteola]|uniref:hypothetical protein n=1 Tax=Labilithrix luteola TaxID=1391654 RepID=UPI0011BA5C95|nr:hypothetical protein [Labilithrix luteola]